MIAEDLPKTYKKWRISSSFFSCERRCEHLVMDDCLLPVQPLDQHGNLCRRQSKRALIGARPHELSPLQALGTEGTDPRRPRPGPSTYHPAFRGTATPRRRRDRAEGYCAPAPPARQSPCACRTAPATDRSSSMAAAPGSMIQPPHHIQHQRQRRTVNQAAHRHHQAAAGADFDPTSSASL